MFDRPDERHGSNLTRATPRGGRRIDARRVGPYRIDAELGRGGMGVVFRAFDERLFVVRAKTAQHGFVPDEDERRDVATLVKALDHLPLAIELAAARTRVMPVKQLLARMTERFKLLAGSGARRDRQATLRATFDWSWELLSDDERSALAQLSVFAGGFTLEAAEAVLALEALWPADAVHALLDESWVRKCADGRFDLLVSVQEYAAEKLAALGASISGTWPRRTSSRAGATRRARMRRRPCGFTRT